MPTPKKSVHDPVDMSQNFHNWSIQKEVSPAIVAATGGTYEIKAPQRENETEEAPVTPKKGPGRPKKLK